MNQINGLEKNIKTLIDKGISLLKERLIELGIKAATSHELLNTAKEIVAHNKNLQLQEANLLRQIAYLETENSKINIMNSITSVNNKRKLEITNSNIPNGISKNKKSKIVSEIKMIVEQNKYLNSTIMQLEDEVNLLEKTHNIFDNLNSEITKSNPTTSCQSSVIVSNDSRSKIANTDASKSKIVNTDASKSKIANNDASKSKIANTDDSRSKIANTDASVKMPNIEDRIKTMIIAALNDKTPVQKKNNSQKSIEESVKSTLNKVDESNILNKNQDKNCESALLNVSQEITLSTKNDQGKRLDKKPLLMTLKIDRKDNSASVKVTSEKASVKLSPQRKQQDSNRKRSVQNDNEEGNIKK